jgi:hypothetical protein
VIVLAALGCREECGRDQTSETDLGSHNVGHSADHTSGVHSAEPLSWGRLDNGFGYSCGLASDGALHCWGSTDRAPPRRQEAVIDFDLAVWTSCALDDEGRVECWCTGLSKRACRDAPTEGGFVKVRSGEYGACAEDASHHLRCWGADAFLSPPTEPVEDWDLEINGGCALVDSEIVCWGDLEELWSLSPDADPLPPSGGGFVQVTVGRDHGCALDKQGEARCWGSTGYLERFPDPPPGPFVRLETFNQITCGLRPDGRAECWYDLNNLLDDWSWPREERWAQLSLGEWDACGVTLDGRGLCFPAEFESYGEQQVPSLDDL